MGYFTGNVTYTWAKLDRATGAIDINILEGQDVFRTGSSYYYGSSNIDTKNYNKEGEASSKSVKQLTVTATLTGQTPSYTYVKFYFEKPFDGIWRLKNGKEKGIQYYCV